MKIGVCQRVAYCYVIDVPDEDAAELKTETNFINYADDKDPVWNQIHQVFRNNGIDEWDTLTASIINLDTGEVLFDV